MSRTNRTTTTHTAHSDTSSVQKCWIDRIKSICDRYNALLHAFIMIIQDVLTSAKVAFVLLVKHCKVSLKLLYLNFPFNMVWLSNLFILLHWLLQWTKNVSRPFTCYKMFKWHIKYANILSFTKLPCFCIHCTDDIYIYHIIAMWWPNYIALVPGP